ncbi:MAG: hypothetical protein HYV28_12680 [Ignavibacteriales bacterium]|nr:hypothetical protein [Ignavibacteriales bacterium]
MHGRALVDDRAEPAHVEELGVLRAKSENNESLWVKIGGEGYETRVVDGLLEIKAEAAMLGYLNAPSPFTPDGWFMTGDSVEIKDDYFRILGRQTEIINVGGEKVFPQEVENVILEVAGVESVTVYGAKNPLLGNVVYAKVTVNNNSLDLRELGSSIKKHCNAKLARYKVPVKILFTEDILISSRYKKDRMGAREE